MLDFVLAKAGKIIDVSGSGKNVFNEIISQPRSYLLKYFGFKHCILH